MTVIKEQENHWLVKEVQQRSACARFWLGIACGLAVGAVVSGPVIGFPTLAAAVVVLIAICLHCCAEYSSLRIIKDGEWRSRLGSNVYARLVVEEEVR